VDRALQEVDRAGIADLRSIPPEVKLRKLDALEQSASLFDWPYAGQQNESVRDLWMTLRRRSGIR
jgi:hypothetical protein